ncbi:hypothetical protein CTAYLR_001914 [Chrysophaeum taylorii]|uniref:Acyltransferase 3 domain-containing protein n=1 Tax=Chrysophaeum taylorii TaxID=2483200 RepID=A0AAD7UA27_9STRA|nr:hypothetical protein CTAYLR_001914 [Chrysophaeum taylorii]
MTTTEEDMELGAALLTTESSSTPSTALLVLFGVSATVFGSSACALVHGLRGLDDDDSSWYRQQLVVIVAVHAASFLVGALSGALLLPQVRRALKGVSGRAEGVEHRWDTVKFTLTVVVAFSHIGLVFVKYAWFEVYNVFKEFWLMQTYFFISGYLSTPEPTRKRFQAIWRSLVGAYVVNQTLYFLFLKLMFAYGWKSTRLDHTTLYGEYYTRSTEKHENFLIEFWHPQGPLWYLPNLVCARLIAPWWMELRRPLFWAVVLQVLILSLKSTDFNDGLAFLCINSLFSMCLPFYVLGIISRRHNRVLNAVFDWPGTWWAAFASFFTFLGSCYVSIAFQLGKSRWFFGVEEQLFDDIETYNEPHRVWFNANTGRLTYAFQEVLSNAKNSELHKYLTFAWYLVVGGNAVRVVMMFSAVRLFSRATAVVLPLFGHFEIDVTAMGKRSISNYLMHWYIYLMFQMTFLETNEHYGAWKVILLIALTFFQSMFWMSKPVYNVVRPIFLAPSMDRLLW